MLKPAASLFHMAWLVVLLLMLVALLNYLDRQMLAAMWYSVMEDIRSVMNFVSISCGGVADWGFGELRDRNVPLNVIFSIFAAAVSVVLVLLIRPRPDLTSQEAQP